MTSEKSPFAFCFSFLADVEDVFFINKNIAIRIQSLSAVEDNFYSLSTNVDIVRSIQKSL